MGMQWAQCACANVGVVESVSGQMSEEYDFDLLCIGSGPAGQRGAVQASKLGKRAAVVEKDRIVGGVSLNAGTMPSKTFREAVINLSSIGYGIRRSTGMSGRPSADQLFARVRNVVQSESAVEVDQLLRNDVVLLRGHARFYDAHTVEVRSQGEKKSFTAENILIAVGARPTYPIDIPIDEDLVITSNGVMGLKRMPRTMVVVGGGVIGMEYASMFAALGIDVTLVDKRQRPLEFVDHEIVDELVHQMRNQNVTFRFEETVERVGISVGPPRLAVIMLGSGKQIVTELVLYSVGRQGEADQLCLDNAGIRADARGRLQVDKQFRTSVPHIFAAGDVIGFPSLASTSAEQG